MRPPEMSGLDGLAGLETVRAQLEEWLDVVRAERARVNLGMQITRPTWKNLVFTGGRAQASPGPLGCPARKPGFVL